MTPNQIGRYKILSKLGQGAMGTVYRAQDPDLNREVALKLVTPQFESVSDQWLWRFRREVQAAGRLNHPHIVTIYDVDLDHAPAFVVMELLTGGTLKNHLQQSPLPWRQAIATLQPLAEALAYAHRVGVVHRDVKPANVMFAGDPSGSAAGENKGVLKLVDFGLTRWQEGEDVSQIWSTAGIIGTPAYMSPEQAQMKVVDARADIFALGIIYFEAITGHNPLARGSLASTMAQIISDQEVDISPLVNKAPPEVVRCIGQAVAKNREQRFSTCEDFLAALGVVTDEAILVSGRAAVSTTLPVNQLAEGPVIQKGKGIRLTTEEEDVLKAMFRSFSRIALETEFGAGLSGSRVFRVRPIEAGGKKNYRPTVVKLAPIDEINKEVQAYESWVEHSLHSIAHLASTPVLPAEGLWGGLSYELAGSDIFNLESLNHFYHQAATSDLLWVLTERLFPIMGRSWWLDNRTEHAFQMQADYDHLLPINLLINSNGPTPKGEPYLIKANSLPPSDIMAGEPVHLQNFVVTEIDVEQKELTLNLPPPLEHMPVTAYRLRLTNVPDVEHYRMGQVLDSVYGVVTHTRHDLLIRQVRRVLGQEIDLAQERLAVHDVLDLPNPLLAYEGILNEFNEVNISTIHGDFNLENILVDPETKDINLIDFATVRQGHALHDLLRLETEVVTKLVPEALTGANLPPETIYPFYHQLHQATFHPHPLNQPHPPHPVLSKSLAMLIAIRIEARKCFFDPDETTEYYQGLILYLLGALKFKNLDAIPQAKAVAFWGAATIVELLTPAAEPALPPCPYRGLEAFDVEHANFFYGRERLTKELLAKLRPNAGPEHRFLGIIGPSGSGKSSLARAGVIAALKRGEIKGSDNWPVIIFKPGANPLRSLAVALTGVSGFGQGLSDVRNMIKEMEEGSESLDLATRLALRDLPKDQRLVILVDQFEEVFTLCHDDSDRQAFFNNLLHAASVPDGQTIVLLTIRADFYGKCAAYPTLAKMLSNHQELVGPMSPEELRQAIEKPAHQAGCQFESGLVELLLNEVKDQPGGLPLLQYALMELWAHQEKRWLLRSAYEEMGGVTGVLEQRAEAVFSQFDHHEQDVCRRIFLRLTQPGEGTEDTKRRVPLAELLPAKGDIGAVEAVLQTLAGAEARLVTTERDEELEGQAIEVAHEALIRSWSRLRVWLDENRDAVRIHRRLTEAATEWVQHDADESYLYMGARLAEAEEWAKAHQDDLSALEQTFLKASIDERDREAAEREALRQRELAQTQALAKAASERARAEAERAQVEASTAKRLRGLVIALAVIFLLAVGAAIFAFTQAQVARTHQGEAEAAEQTAQSEANARATAQAVAEIRQEEAETQAQIAQSRALASAAISNLDTDPELSILLALEAVSTSNTREAEQALHRAVQTSRVRRTLPGNSRETTGHTDEVWQVAFNSDGTLLATASADNTAKIWDVESGQELLTLSGHVDDVLDVAFSPDGTLLATASEDNTAKIWDAESGQEALTLSDFSAEVQSVSFDPTGTRLAVASEKVVSLWDVSTGEMILEFLRLHTDEVTDLAYSPDGRFIASVGRDHTGYIWNASTGQVVLSLGGHTNDIVAVAFSPDGTRLATASRDETVRVWRLIVSAGGDSVSSQPLFSLSNQSNVVWDVTFSPDGGQLATANTDGTAQIWNAASGQLLLNLAGHTDIVRGVAFSPDGSQLATGSRDKTAKIWDVAGHNDVASHVTFSPDGHYLASASQDGTAKVWQISSNAAGEEIALRERLTIPFPSVVRRVAFSPDGQRLALTGQANIPQIWDISAALETGVVGDEPLLRLEGHSDWVFGLSFSPDGSRLATAGDDGLIKLWDARTGEELLTLSDDTSLTSDLDFSPDGKLLASVSGDDIARLWNLETVEARYHLEYANSVSGVAFSADGARLAVVGVDGTADIWDATLGEKLLSLVGHTNWVRDVAFSPVVGDNRLATASYDRTAKIWDATSGQTLLTLGSNVEVNSVAFSPDGQLLATAQADGTVHLYVLELDRLVKLARSRLTRSWRLKECQQYLQLEECPDGP